MIKNILRVFGIIAIIVIGIVLFVFFIFSPTPNFMRNNEINGVKINIKVSNDERIPITRTFEKKEYINLNEDELSKVKDKISGKIEGDIPCIHLNINNRLYFKFEKDGKVVNPIDPKINIYASASDYRDPVSVREINSVLSKKDDGTYFYESRRYGMQYEKYFMEYLRVEVMYNIDGVDYVSTFAVNQDNATDGTDFFKNENLENPIEP